MSEFTVTIPMPEFLKDFYLHVSGGTEPIRLRRGSPESALIVTFIARQPPKTVPETTDEAAVQVYIPTTKAKDPRTYNYLPELAKLAFVDCVRSMFDYQIWKDLMHFRNFPKKKENLIYAWMEQYGIEPTEKNFNAVNKRFLRLRKTAIEADKARSQKNQKNSTNPEP